MNNGETLRKELLDKIFHLVYSQSFHNTLRRSICRNHNETKFISQEKRQFWKRNIMFN